MELSGRGLKRERKPSDGAVATDRVEFDETSHRYADSARPDQEIEVVVTLELDHSSLLSGRVSDVGLFKLAIVPDQTKPTVQSDAVNLVPGRALEPTHRLIVVPGPGDGRSA